MRRFWLPVLLAFLFMNEGHSATDGRDDLPHPPEGSLWDRIELPNSTSGDDADTQQAAQSQTHRPTTFIDYVIEQLQPPASLFRDPFDRPSTDPLHIGLIEPADFDIPIIINDEVIHWIQHFSGPAKHYFSDWIAKGGRYTPMMKEKLEEAGLPQDLLILSMIERGYRTNAYRHANAACLWQFIG